MKDILTRLFRHEELSTEEACGLMQKLTSGQCSEAHTAALLSVFRMRGIRVNELLGFRQALLQTQQRIDLSEFSPIDIVGTGGDGKNTFNISTCACFLVAGAGYRVAKHGNYGATSVSGASNVLEQHGVRFSNRESDLKRSLEGCGMAFLHAPLFTPALKHVAAVRRALQFRTVFNLLGPLVNPCCPEYRMLGVADLAQMRLYTNAFHRLGVKFTVVNNLDGYDEISLTSDFKVMSNNCERIYTPEQMGVRRVAQNSLCAGNTPEQAARIFADVLYNRATREQTDCVLVNAAFGIHTVDEAKPVEECMEEARESLLSGRAAAVFKRFIGLNS